MKKFTLFLSNINNSILTKDVGIIPYLMKKHYNYNSSIISLKTEETLTDNKKYLENLSVNIIRDNSHLNEELRDIDVLMLIGIYEFNITIAKLYKQINKLGKIYLKLDASLFWMHSVDKNMNQHILDFLKSCDLITVEGRRLQHLLNTMWNMDIKYIPNGYFNFSDDDKFINYEEKNNTILFAGRVGSPEKNNQMLLEAFKQIEDKIPNWNIEFAGSVEDSFLVYLNEYFKGYEHLRKRIVFSGKHDKYSIKNVYKRAKIFCLTSLSEACANVFSEAVANGCYLITTDVDGAIDIIDYGKYGSIVPINHVYKLSQTLLEVCNDDKLLKENCEKSQIYAKENLSWVSICGEINNMIW